MIPLSEKTFGKRYKKAGNDSPGIVIYKKQRNEA
jgi:hypothetical protein